MIVSKTNYRISVLGGGNDTPDFFTKHGSYIIGFGLNHHVYVMVNLIPKIDEVCYQAFYSFSEKVHEISEFKNPSIYGALTFLEKKLGKLPYLSIHVNNNLPSSCGIGSSSALIVGILNAVYTLMGEKITQQQLAEETNFIERELLEEPGGRQDPIWCSYGGIGSLNINTDGKLQYERFNLSQEFIREFHNWSLIFYHSKRPSFQIAKSYKNEKAEVHKLRLLEIAKEGEKYFREENLEKIKDCLDLNWAEKKSISNMISTSDIDQIYNLIKLHGGTMKVCGAGGGGALYCMCPPNKRDTIISEIKLPIIPMGFDFGGSRIVLDI